MPGSLCASYSWPSCLTPGSSTYLSQCGVAACHAQVQVCAVAAAVHFAFGLVFKLVFFVSLTY